MKRIRPRIQASEPPGGRHCHIRQRRYIVGQWRRKLDCLSIIAGAERMSGVWVFVYGQHSGVSNIGSIRMGVPFGN